jgi:threonine/homoserine efflux transporter RhtA
MVLGGIGGTLIGWLLGGGIGSAGAEDGWDGLVYGAMVGATIGVPFGVHYGNHAQGSLLNDLLVSSAIGAAGILVTSKTDYGWAVLLTPLAQFIATTAMEDHAVRRVATQDASQ